ncbi:helix-turn-helix domain-containing protein [Sphingomonas sp. PB2P19]|uniref:helix-turn-helix domain-containing protein n=1 Tax=Sphingomonas rhamnosi TaxID=3096156 RepID=UPI002FC76C34
MLPAPVEMPAGMAIRYDMPCSSLASAITGYTAYSNESRDPQVDWFLPAPVMLCVALDAGPIHPRIGNRPFPPMPQASVIGPTSRALSVTTHGGTMVGIGISAAGWAALTGRSAVDFHNRIVPADTVLDPAIVEALVATLSAAPSSAEFRPLLDAFLPPLFVREDPNDALVRALMRLVVRPGMIEVGELAEELGITASTLRRLAHRYFGMPSKLLLRRARFLRSFLQLFVSGNPTDVSAIDPSYHDMPHFLRDSNTFLGTTPRRFMQLANPFLEASVRTRAAVLGAPTQALHIAPLDVDQLR